MKATFVAVSMFLAVGLARLSSDSQTLLWNAVPGMTLGALWLCWEQTRIRWVVVLAGVMAQMAVRAGMPLPWSAMAAWPILEMGVAFLVTWGLVACARDRQESMEDLKLRRLVFLGCLLASATLSGIRVKWVGVDESMGGRWWFGWLGGWMADALGYLVMAPLVVRSERWLRAWKVHDPVLEDQFKLARGTGLLILSGSLVWVAHEAGGRSWHTEFALLYLPLLALLYGALRFGPTAMILAVAVHVAVAFWVGHRDPGWWANEGEASGASVLRLQFYVLLNAGISMLISRVIHEREKALERQRAVEVKMKRMEDLYRSAITAANAVPYYRDYVRNKFTFMGDGIISMTGYDHHPITPDLWDRIVQQRVLRGALQGVPFHEAVRRTRAGEVQNWQCDCLIIVPSGEERWISDISVEMMNENGVSMGSIGILIDVTERRRVEEEVRLMNEGLEQRIQERTVQLQSAVKELESFTYSVSHDLRAPLRAIEGFTRILQEDHAAVFQPEALDLLQRVRAAAIRMDVLIHSLLSFSRLSRQSLVRRPTDMNLLVREVLEELSCERKDRRVTVEVQDLPPCHADPALIRQVWLNLLSNALKYTRKTKEARVEVGVFTLEEETVYWVKDNGVGFDMKYADKLFGVFQRLHREEHFDGTGVGLAIVHRILRRHEGSVWAESAPGAGATFFFKVGSGPGRGNESKESAIGGGTEERSHSA